MEIQWIRTNEHEQGYGLNAYECTECGRVFADDDYPGKECPSDDCPSHDQQMIGD